MAAGHRSEHQDDGEEAGCGGGRVLQELQPGVPGGELLGGDARADDDRGQECAAQELGGEPAGQSTSLVTAAGLRAEPAGAGAGMRESQFPVD